MSVDLNLVKALLFDVDGTLSDTDDHMITRLVRFFNPVKWMFKNKDPRPFSHWLVMASETPANFIYSIPDRLGIDVHLARIYNWIARVRFHRSNPGDLFMLVEGVRETLQILYPHYPMGVVSARDGISTGVFLKHFGLEQYFQVVVTNQTCQRTKPFPDPILYAAEVLKVKPEHCLMIGDTQVDVHSALAAGAQSLSVLCGFGIAEELAHAGTHAILDNTSLVKDLFFPGLG